MDDLLTSVRTTRIVRLRLADSETGADDPAHEKQDVVTPKSADDVLELLKSKPDRKQLLAILRWLDGGSEPGQKFNIHIPGPKAAQILFLLVDEVNTTYWDTVSALKSSEDGKLRALLLRCLRSVPAVGAIISRIRRLIESLKNPQDAGKGLRKEQIAALIVQSLSILEAVMRKDEFAILIWKDVQTFESSPSQKSLQWKEFLSIFAYGRLLNVASEANRVVNGLSPDLEDGSWLGDGRAYVTWLGKNVSLMIKRSDGHGEEGIKAAMQILSKGLTIGYEDSFIREAFSDTLRGNEQALQSRRTCFGHLAERDRKAVLNTMIRILTERALNINAEFLERKVPEERDSTLGAVATLIRGLTDGVAFMLDDLVTWLTRVPAEVIVENHFAHRAVALALSCDQERIFQAFQKALEIFGDKLFIKHTPILQQDAQAQTLISLAGYVYRDNKSQLVRISTSSQYLNGISNRLAAASEKPRHLGMIVGSIISEIVDQEGKRMNFSSIDSDSAEFRHYRSLAYSLDRLGPLNQLASNRKAKEGSMKKEVSLMLKPNDMKKPVSGSKIIAVEEVEDLLRSEDDDLPVYAKADLDPSDSESDPELVQRNKPTAPVYIQDLIKGLRDLENYDRNKLALSNVAPLIRRKSAFGTEVIENARVLANILVGLNDKWEMDGFQRLRLQGMIAILVADPVKMGPWFAETFYNGDYSISQRASILTTLGLGAREIAGIGRDDSELTGSDVAENNFPSKLLPEKLHKYYTGSPNPSLPAASTSPLKAISSNLEKSIIQPLAAQAADKLIGPNALKVRTFSSRMAVERKRAKPAPNKMAKIAAESFLFPLVGRWQIHLQAYGGDILSGSRSGSGSGAGRPSSTVVTSPFLLETMLRTFALILHAAGPTLANRSQVTTEMWGLLLSVRSLAGEVPVLEGLLFAVLTLLEINIGDGGDAGGRRLAEEHARELLETQSWVEGIVEVSGSEGEGEKVGMLAAAVLVRCREVVERYQRLLMGDLVDFM